MKETPKKILWLDEKFYGMTEKCYGKNSKENFTIWCWKRAMRKFTNKTKTLYKKQSQMLSVRKLRTQGFSLQICEPISYRKHLRICGKKLKSITNRKFTTLLDRFLAISKKVHFTNQCNDRFGWMYL